MKKELEKLSEGVGYAGVILKGDEMLVIQTNEQLNPNFFDVFDSTHKKLIYISWNQLSTILLPGEEVEVHSNIGCRPNLPFIRYIIKNENGKAVRIRQDD